MQAIGNMQWRNEAITAADDAIDRLLSTSDFANNTAVITQQVNAAPFQFDANGDGNSDIRVWNDILPSISVATGETGPSFQSNNQIWKGGGGGPGLVPLPPVFALGDINYAPVTNSPGNNSGLLNAETPSVDYMNRLRDDMPDIGAREFGATTPVCF